MAFVHPGSLGWHEGEEKMHSLLHVPHQDNPTAPGLTSYGAHLLRMAPLMALGTLDDGGRPWTTLLGGEPGFARPIGPSIIGVKTLVDSRYDPVVHLLVGGEQNGEVSKEKNNGRLFSALPIDLATRSRVKIAGRMVAGALGSFDSRSKEDGDSIGEAQLVFKVEESLGMQTPYSIIFLQS